MNWSCPACALGVSVSPRATTCRPKTLTRNLAFLVLLLSLAACTEPAPESAPVLRCGHRQPQHVARVQLAAGQQHARADQRRRLASSIRRVESSEMIQGDIARVMLYMADTYRLTLSRQDQQLFTAWSRQDPPDAWEIERNRRIKAIQGQGNRFVDDYAALFGQATPVATAPAPVPAAPATPASVAANPSGWTCGAKTTCGQMASREEAKFHRTHCGVKSLDRDGDGVPCASLCRT